MTKRIYVFDELCSGCESCVMWCAFAMHRTFDRKQSRIRVAKDLDRAFDMPIVDCIGEDCENKNEKGEPLCVEMCPSGCLVFTDAEDAYQKRVELHRARQVQPLFKLIAPWRWPYPWREWAKEEVK